MTDLVPYVVALVELDAGAYGATIRVMSNIVNCEPELVCIGDHVELVWEPLTDGRNLPCSNLPGTHEAIRASRDNGDRSPLALSPALGPGSFNLGSGALTASTV